MAILYQTAKFKSTNIFAIAILGSTAKFNSRQYFRLYGSYYRTLAKEGPWAVHLTLGQDWGMG